MCEQNNGVSSESRQEGKIGAYRMPSYFACFALPVRAPGLFIALGWVLVIVLASYAVLNWGDVPRAKGGQLNLSQWDFDRDGSLPLNGEWEMVRGRLVGPDDFSADRQDTVISTVPGCWNGSDSERYSAGGHGAATYRLSVQLPLQTPTMVIWIKEQSTAYRLWVGGKLVAERGIVASNPSRHRAGVGDQTRRIDVSDKNVDFVLQVSNFSARLGGAISPIILGERGALIAQQRRWRDLDVALFGSLIVMSLYHAGLYLLRRKERSALLIALICAVFALRIPFFGMSGRPIVEYFPQASWELCAKFEAVTPLWGLAAIFHYVALRLSDTQFKSVARWVTLLVGLLTVAAFALPRYHSESATRFWFAGAAVGCVYTLVVAVRAARRGEPAGRDIVVGWFLLATAGLLEIITDLMANTGTHLPVVPLGVFAFLIMQSWVASHRLHQAFEAIESLSEELKTKLAVERELEMQRRSGAVARQNADRERLEKLRYQLNPHFLFNALTSIRGVLSNDWKAAKDMVTALADYYRATLTHGQYSVVVLDSEIALTRLFLRSARGTRTSILEVDWRIDEQLGSYRVPSFILQPLVENAIKYGRRDSAPTPPLIRIEARSRDGRGILIRVSNTGSWVAPRERGDGGHGLGLGNVGERLKYHFGEEASIEVCRGGGWVHVTMYLPWQADTDGVERPSDLLVDS